MLDAPQGKHYATSPRRVPAIFSWSKWLSPFVLAALLAVPTSAETTTVRLHNGTAVTGVILHKKSDRVVIDLGFTVLTIPADEIESIVDNESAERPADAAAQADIYRSTPFQDELTVKENVIRCGEAVVEIRTPTGLGSGFLIDPSGYVVTNNHVIAGEHRLSITIFHHNGQELQKITYDKVAIVATNPYVDLALLRILDADDREFSSLPLGDSDSVRQGQPVFAVGSPLGFERSVSEGIVSLRNRPMGGRLFIQSTTQLNAGNSGGPLVNLRGEVVGVNNLKIAAAGVEGLSFSIVVNALKEFLGNRDAFAFDPRNANAGFRYGTPPQPDPAKGPGPGR